MFPIQTFQGTISIKPGLSLISDPLPRGGAAAGRSHRDASAEATGFKMKTPSDLRREERGVYGTVVQCDRRARALRPLEAVWRSWGHPSHHTPRRDFPVDKGSLASRGAVRVEGPPEAGHGAGPRTAGVRPRAAGCCGAGGG